MSGFEIIEVSKKTIACDGGKGALGHPRVFLTFPKDSNSLVCPYCSREYIYKSSN